MPEIKLFLADVDGTLVTKDKVLTERGEGGGSRARARRHHTSPSPAAGRRAA